MIERIIAYRSYAIRYRYTCKTAATAERPIADRSNAIRYRYVCKTAAIIERLRVYRSYAVGDCNTRKSTAT